MFTPDGKPFRMIYKEEWDAVATDPYMTTMPGEPAEYVLLTHTNTDPCHDDDECRKVVKQLQTDHMASGLDDIQWNFLVGGSGKVYEGRGWELAADKDIEFEQYYKKSIDIAYIGRFGGNHVTPEMEEAVEKLVSIGVQGLYIARNHDYIGHKEHVGFQG